MAGPCMTDSNCITSTQLPDGTVQWDIQLTDDSGLECTVDGLQVNRLGSAASVASPCNLYNNTLRTSTAGELFAVVPNAAYASQSNSDHSGIPHTGAFSADNLNFTLTNPYDCTLLGLVTGKFVINYDVQVAKSGTYASGDMYSAQVIANVLADGTEIIEHHFDIGGDLRRASGSGTINLKAYEHFHAWITMNPGQSRTFRTRAQLEGTQELSDNITLDSGGKGLRSQIQVCTFPFGNRSYS